MKRNWPVIGVVVAVVVAGLALWAWRYYEKNLVVRVPEYAQPTKSTWLKQNWTPGQSAWFHHADQGTLTFGMPYEWLVALEKPVIFGAGPTVLMDPAYMDRFGFIADGGAGAGAGAEKLPVGFAHGGDMALPTGKPWLNPQTGKAFSGVGLTCAACHTGRLTYKGEELLVDGGPALTNLGKFRQAVGVSVLYTRWVPGRLDEFAARVLGPNASDAAKAGLKAQIDAFLDAGKTGLAWDKALKVKSVDEGFARLDALNRIGNQVFATDMNQQVNYVAASAPVHFPRIWQAPWFMWVQYNGSIMQPMVRNAGEALGVGARLQTAGPDLFASSVNVPVLYAMESQLACDLPEPVKSGAADPYATQAPPPDCAANAAKRFPGLRPPLWRDTALPPIDRALAAQGAKLYEAHCQGCHMPPTSSTAFWTAPQWKPPPPTVDGKSVGAPGALYLDLEVIPLAHIGTDPGQAAGMAARKVQIPAGVGIQSQGFGRALGDLVARVTDHWFNAQQPPTPPDVRNRMDGGRPNGIRAPLGYKVRPLDGIWATPPYLHNGSVPTVYDLLSPVSERPKTFTLGNREYDPAHLGYQTGPFKNGFEFDTTQPGNSNKGHEFSDAPGPDPKHPEVRPPGVIGPALKPQQRMALIEYLKTLGEPEPSGGPKS